MDSEEIKSLKIEFKGEEADRFKSTIKKVHEEISRAGFNNSTLNGDELKLIKDINEKVNKP